MHTEPIVTFPTMAEVIAADLVQLETWSAQLPRPNSDVQRSVRARIERRIALLSTPADHEGSTAPHVEDSVAQVRALLGLVGDPSTFDRGFTIH